jgi:hypothetical protein
MLAAVTGCGGGNTVTITFPKTPSPTPATPSATATIAPSATATVPATATSTVAATATAPSPTSTAAPNTPTRAPTRTGTSTQTATATRGESPTSTATVGPTRTATTAAVPTDTAVATATALPTGTAAATVTPSATQSVPLTATPIPTATVRLPTSTMAAETSTVAPTATATSSSATHTPPASATVTPIPTETAIAAEPELDLGAVAGTAGASVLVPVTLMSHGAPIAAISNDIDYDSADVDVAIAGGAPDCTIDPRLGGSKQVHAAVLPLAGTRKRLRVGVIGSDNNEPITDGTVYACRFAVPLTAPAEVELANAPAASSPQATALAVTGSDGRIIVAPAPAALGLSTGTASAGGTAEVTASFRARGRTLAAIATDIRFDAALASIAEVGDVPDCTLDPAVAAAGKMLFAATLPEIDGLAGVRVGVIGVDDNAPLPSSDEVIPVFRCRIAITAGSGTVTLDHVATGAAPDARPVPVVAEPGAIEVQ